MISVPNMRPFHLVDRTPLIQAERDCEGRYCIDIDATESFWLNGPGWKYHNGELVVEIMQNPTAIFTDLKRENREESFAYAGQPSYRYDNSGNKEPLADGWVMIAFGSIEFNEIVFDDWDFRPGDDAHPGFPHEWQTDFGVLLWPTD